LYIIVIYVKIIILQDINLLLNLAIFIRSPNVLHLSFYIDIFESLEFVWSIFWF